MDVLKKPVSVWVAVALLVTSLIGTGVYITRSGDDSRAQPTSVRVEVAQARRGSLVREMTVVGTLESANSVVMKAQVKGLITKVNILGGEEVRKGDVLFEIDPRSYQARAKEAKALHDLAKATLDREEKLAAKNFGAVKKLEEARAQFLKTQAQLESAQKDLEDTKIVAPFDGYVGLHRVSIGTPISADLDLVTVTDTDPMKVNFKMPSKFVRYLSLDQKVTVEVDSYAGQKFEGRIEAIDALVDSGAQSIAVQASIPNEKNLLKPGMFVRVKVTVGSKDNSLIIPEEAIVAIGDQTYVWKVIEHPEKPGLFIVFRVEVLTGIQEKDRIEVTRNLREDDIVVTIGYQKVANGVPVSFDMDSIEVDSKDPDEKPENTAQDSDPQDQVQQNSEEAQTDQDQSPSFWDKVKGLFSSKPPAPNSNDKPEDKAVTEDPVTPGKSEDNKEESSTDSEATAVETTDTEGQDTEPDTKTHNETSDNEEEKTSTESASAKPVSPLTKKVLAQRAKPTNLSALLSR